MVKVSVCISVHNTASLLPRCLDSVCAQTLQDLEIVLVNNGSTDKSEVIMREYENQHPERRFIIVSQEDRGLAQGRQSGVNCATGEYITFLDADDYVSETAYEKMYTTAINENVDIVEIQTRRENRIISSPFDGKQNTHYVLRRWFVGDIFTPTMLWLRLYKKELFDKPVLPNLYTNNEDNFAYPCLLYRANSIYYLKEPLHEYTTDNENGYMKRITTDPSYTDKLFKAKVTALKSVHHIENYIGKETIHKDYCNEFNTFKANMALVFILKQFKNVPYKEKINVTASAISVAPRNLPLFIRKNINCNCSVNRLAKLFGIMPVHFVYSLFRN